jgi:hypothetical protein
MFDKCVDEVLGLGKTKTGPSFNVLRISRKKKTPQRELQSTSVRECEVIAFLDCLVKSGGVDVCPKSGEKYYVKESWKSLHKK